MSVLKLEMVFRLFLFFLLFFCFFGEVQARESLRVVTSFSILEDFAKELGGDRVVVETILPRQGDPHSYQIRPSDVRKVSEADIIIFSDYSFEGWMTRLLGASKFDGKLVIVGSDLGLPKDGSEGESDHGHEEEGHGHGEEGHGHGHGEEDSHFWHDPHKVIIVARKISKVFVGADSRQEDYYVDLLLSFESRVRELEQELRSKLSDVGGGVILLQHGGMAHFSRTFDIYFDQLEGLGGVSTVSGNRLQQLEKELSEGDIDGIAYEYGRSGRLLRMLSEESCVSIDGPVYIDNLGEEGGVAGTWFDMMRHNVSIIIEVLSSKRAC